MFRPRPLPCLLVFLAVIMLGVTPAFAADPLWRVNATNGELTSVVVSQDGSTIVAGGDQLIALAPDGTKRWTGWSSQILMVSRNGGEVLTSRDTTLRLIDGGTGTLRWSQSIGVVVVDASMTPDESLIAACGGSYVWILNGTGTGFRANRSIVATHLRIFPAGDRLVITSRDGVMTSNLTLFNEWADTKVPQDMVEVAGNGSSFVTVTNNRIRKYARNGDMLWEQRLPGGNALSFALSRDGSTIVVGRDDDTVTILDADGNVLWTDTAKGWVTSVAVSDTGDTIAAGSFARDLTVYDHDGSVLATFTVAAPIRAHSVAMSGDGSVIAVTDATAVYGFARPQLAAEPEPANPVNPVATPSGTVAPPATTVMPSVPAATQMPATTIHEPLFPAVAVLAAGIAVLFRPGKKGRDPERQA